jgi:polyadenylate-binding protein
MPITYNSLSTLSTVVRKEVLTGEVSRQVKSLEAVDDKDVETIVESIVSLSLSNVLQILEDSTKLKDQVEHFKSKLPRTGTIEEFPSRPASQATSQDSRLLDNNAAASAPEHPSTPISLSPARTSSPAGSMPPVSERDRLFAAIAKFESSREADLTELIMSLPRRERALCLFNTEVLRAKLADAKMVLDSESADDEDGKPSDTQSTKSAPVPSTPQAKKSVIPQLEASPHPPDLSSAGASNATSSATSPAPVTPSLALESSHTIASLAKLPAAEIVKFAISASATGLLLPKADPLIVQATDEFIDQLISKPPAIQKQALGEKLYVFLPFSFLFFLWFSNRLLFF